MSAAEPADPARPYMNAPGAGAVIDITTRRRPGGARLAAEGRWSMAGTPTGPSSHLPGAGAERSSLELFADDLEKSFNDVDHSLTDDRTVAVFLRTLDVVQVALEGSEATGIITAEQLAELAVVIQGMREAPRLVSS